MPLCKAECAESGCLSEANVDLTGHGSSCQSGSCVIPGAFGSHPPAPDSPVGSDVPGPGLRRFSNLLRGWF